MQPTNRPLREELLKVKRRVLEEERAAEKAKQKEETVAKRAAEKAARDEERELQKRHAAAEREKKQRERDEARQSPSSPGAALAQTLAATPTRGVPIANVASRQGTPSRQVMEAQPKLQAKLEPDLQDAIALGG